MWIYVASETWSVFGVGILSGSFSGPSPGTWTFLGAFFLDLGMWTGTAYAPSAGSGFGYDPSEFLSGGSRPAPRVSRLSSWKQPSGVPSCPGPRAMA